MGLTFMNASNLKELEAKFDVLEQLVIELTLIAMSNGDTAQRVRLNYMLSALQYAGVKSPNDKV